MSPALSHGNPHRQRMEADFVKLPAKNYARGGVDLPRERDKFIFLVYHVREDEPYEPREVRLLTTNPTKVRDYLGSQIQRGNIQYGEWFSQEAQYRAFRKEWDREPKSRINAMMRYGAVSATIDGKELREFRINTSGKETVYSQEEKENPRFIFIVFNTTNRASEVNLFTTDPRRLRKYFEDKISTGEIRYGHSKDVPSQIEEFKTDWQSKPKSFINGKLKGCAMTAVIDGRALETFGLS